MLNDGVLELAPFPSNPLGTVSSQVLNSGNAQDEVPQGILRVHQLPVLHEKGGGGTFSNGFGDDLTFSLSRRRGLVIKPFSLPPVDGDSEAQPKGLNDDIVKATKLDIEF
jgi:elongator complex protein 4